MLRIFANKFFLTTVIVFTLSLAVRFVSLDRVPASLYYDEIDLGYQIRSFLETGRDYRNSQSPFYFRSFNTDKTPLPVYFSLVPSLFFKSPEYQTRAGAALAGVLVVVVSMAVSFQLTRKKLPVVLTGLVFGFSPWLIHFSRIAFEAIFMLLLVLASLCMFYHYLSSQKRWAFYLTSFLIGLSVYTYRPMSLFAPLMVLLIVGVYHKQFLKEGIKAIVAWLFTAAIVATPFLYATTIGSKDQPRINQISIFSDAEIPVFVQRNREVDSHDFTNPQIGKQAVPSSYLFHNKLVSALESFTNNYFRSFSTQFLFISGDPNNRHNPKDTGELLYLDLLGLILGAIFLFKNINKKPYQLLVGLLLLAPIPSSLTMDGGQHASRLILLAGPLLLITSLGYSYLVNVLLSKSWLKPLLALAVLQWITSVVFYLHQYFTHYSVDSAREFGYGYRQAFHKINQLRGDYREIRLTAKNDPPMLYYFYFTKTSPEEVQEYGTDYSDNIIKNLPLDHVKPISFSGLLCEPKEIDKLRPDTLYLVSYKDIPLDFRSPDKDQVPQGIKLLDVIKYPDNEVAYYLITRETQTGKPIPVSKTSSCK